MSSLVVEKREDCPDDKVAAIGPPGEVTVFSGATGLSIAPAGFAAGAAGLLGLGGLALLLGGAAAAGIASTVVVFNNATPTATATAEATNTATPTPTNPPIGPPPPVTP